MHDLAWPPNGKVLLDSLLLNPEKLRSDTKTVIKVSVIRALLRLVVSKLPFDAEFYCSTYLDVAAAHRAGAIADLHEHFINAGFFEGRLGAKPAFDADFYLQMYPDVAEAVRTGAVESALYHYLNGGAAEGRFANSDDRAASERWLDIVDFKA